MRKPADLCSAFGMFVCLWLAVAPRPCGALCVCVCVWAAFSEIRIDRANRDDAETAYIYAVANKPGHFYLQPHRGLPDLWYGCDHERSVLKAAPREWEQWKLVALDKDRLPRGGSGLLGGIVGAVGGAVTGLLITGGNPVGAVAGAVAGGVAGVQNGEKGVTYISIGFPAPTI